jgi:hypothetical protein
LAQAVNATVKRIDVAVTLEIWSQFGLVGGWEKSCQLLELQ